MLNNRHKATGEVFAQAIESMTTLNAARVRGGRSRPGSSARTDVTGFGLLGHLYKLARASGVTAVIDAAAVPYLAGAREAVRAGYVTRRDAPQPGLGRPHADRRRVGRRGRPAAARRSRRPRGGLLLAGEVPGAPVIGELVPRGEHVLEIR